MIFKVFCDINVSQIESEDLNEDENICYEFVPKFDDDKENWDPNGSKKNSVSTTSLNSNTIEKKDNNDSDSKQQKKEIVESKKQKIVIDKNNANENELIKETSKPEVEEKADINNKKIAIGEKSKSEFDVIKDTSEDKIKVSNSENDTTILEENISLEDSKKISLKDSENTSEVMKKKEEYLRKRQRIPLEDITFLFVPKEHIALLKRARDDKENSTKINNSTEKVTKPENKHLIKKHNITSENSKENKQQIYKTPLSDISNRSNIKVNNNNNIKNFSNKKSINDIPKPCIINVKQNKPVKRSIIPKKRIKIKAKSN